MKLNNVERTLLLTGLFKLDEEKVKGIIENLSLEDQEKNLIRNELVRIHNIEDGILDSAFEKVTQKIIYSLLLELKKRGADQ